MPGKKKKKKEEVNIDALDFKPTLEETVACSILGRIMASYGATLTGREKRNAGFVYFLLKAERELPKDTPTTAKISEKEKPKKYSPIEAIKWFEERYPKWSQPLIKKLKEMYDQKETSVIYGLKPGEDLIDDFYISVMEKVLRIPQQDAGVMYHGVIKPQIKRLKEKEGLVSMVMEKSK